MALIFNDSDKLLTCKYLKMLLSDYKSGDTDLVAVTSELEEVILAAASGDYDCCLGHMRDVVDSGRKA